MSTRLLVFLGVDYLGGSLVLKFYDVTNDRPLVVKDGTGHRPYFLVRGSLRDVVPKLREAGYEKYRLQYVTRYDPLEGRDVKLVKVIVEKPSDVAKLRDIFGGSAYEAHIRYRYCYIFDSQLEPFGIYLFRDGELVRVPTEIRDESRRIVSELCGDDKLCIDTAVRIVEACETPLPPLKRCALDIEVATPREGQIPDPDSAEYPILAVSICGSDGLKRVYVNGSAVRDRSGSDLVPEGVEVVVVDDERVLLEKVFETVRSYPIVLTYNGDEFDLPYLMNRAERLGVEDVPIVLREYPTFRHGIHLDLYKFFSVKAVEEYAFDRAYKHTSKSLDDVAHVLTGLGKYRPSRHVSELSLGELVYYCFRDSFLTLYLTYFSNQLVMRLIVLLSRISYTLPEDLCRRQISFWIRNLLYAEHRRRSWLIPNRENIAKRAPASTRGVREASKYAGGITLEPVRGAFENVVVVDFASLYPSIIKNLNLSYETINCSCCSYRPHPDLPHRVCRKRRGLVATVVGTLRDLRVYLYKRLAKTAESPTMRQMYDAVQRALKVFINASYGVFGAEHFDLYCPALAELVTAIGRMIFASTLTKALELGAVPIYGDTDSLFLWNVSEDTLKKLQDWCLETFGVELDIDRMYRVCMFTGRKKTYVGIYRDGAVDVKGLARSRSEPEIVKHVQEAVLEHVQKVESVMDIDAVRYSIAKVLSEVHRRLRKRMIPLNMLTIRATLQKDLDQYSDRTVYARVGKMLREHGVHVGKGTTLHFVKTVLKEGYIPVQLASIADVDVDYYINRILSRLSIVLESIGLTRDDLKSMYVQFLKHELGKDADDCAQCK